MKLFTGKGDPERRNGRMQGSKHKMELGYKPKRKTDKLLKIKSVLKPFWKKHQTVAIVAIIAVIMVIGLLVTTIVNGVAGLIRAANTLKEPNLNGMTVSAACATAKKDGWTKFSISGVYNGSYSITRDAGSCSDTKHKVNGAYYYQVGQNDLESTVTGAHVDITYSLKESELTSDEKAQLKQDESDNDSNSSSDSDSSSKASSSNTSTSTDSSKQTASTSSSSASSSDTVTPSLKKTLDAYESFMDKYVDFMKQYKANPSDTSLISQYASMMSDYSKYVDSINKIDQSTLSTADAAYYVEVTGRVVQKLAEIQ